MSPKTRTTPNLAAVVRNWRLGKGVKEVQEAVVSLRRVQVGSTFSHSVVSKNPIKANYNYLRQPNNLYFQCTFTDYSPHSMCEASFAMQSFQISYIQLRFIHISKLPHTCGNKLKTCSGSHVWWWPCKIIM